MRLTFSRRFIDDCFECDCDVGDVYRETKSTITLDLSDAQAAELRSRAAHYVDGVDGPGLVGLQRSAEAVLRKLDAAAEEERRAADIHYRGMNGGVADLEELAAVSRDSIFPGLDRPFTAHDVLRIVDRPGYVDRFAYFHNGVRIERDRAVELIGERA